jgi:hypothetical protein
MSFVAGFEKVAFSPMGMLNTAKKVVQAPGVKQSIGRAAARGAAAGAVGGALSKDEKGDRFNLGNMAAGAAGGAAVGAGARLGGGMAQRLGKIKGLQSQRADNRLKTFYGTHGTGD